MANVQIVTDSTAYFTKEYVDNNNIRVVPLSVTFSGVSGNEGFPGQFEEFYHKLETSRDFPTTSQPSIEAFTTVFEEIIASGSEVVAIVISEKLSGTFNSASAAATLVAPDKITVIDSETSVANLKLLVKIAASMAKNGRSREDITAAIEREKKRMSVNLTVGSLEYLRRGGRLSGAQAMIGSLLNVKPIISLIDGKLEAVAKVRGKSKALEYLIDNVPDNAVHITICHILNLEEAQMVRDRLQAKFPHINVDIDEIGPVIGSHLGPKSLGICCKW